MRHWFESLPVHRKLIAMALLVSTAALAAAVTGLVAFDVARFRNSAADDARALAQVIAENSAAAIVFNDADAARQTLTSVEVRPVISRACVYRGDGSLLAAFRVSGASACPAVPASHTGWAAVSSVVPVQRNGQAVGRVYVERELSDLPTRVIVTAAAALLMLLVAGAVAFGVASRLQHIISEPIVALSKAARAIGRDQRYEIPPIAAPPDETGDLVRAFSDMVARLVSSNEALATEVEQRTRMQAEREELLAREREASRLKDEFLAAVSHELRTPLNAILGWAQVLASTKPNEQTVTRAIASLSRNAQAQKRVIEDLLDVSRIITGKLQLSLNAVDLRTVVESAIEVVMPSAAAKNVRLEVDLPQVPQFVQGDFDRLRQVLWNLLSNAVKFTPSGGMARVRVARADYACQIIVSDTGIGIPPAFLPHVFERFRQADGSTTREHGGLGLGLAIVKELTELHGGTVTAASGGTGHGATFTVMLPRLLAVEAADSPADVTPTLVRLDGVDVLAVDDNPDALDLVTSALSDAGATVRIAASGVEALEQIRRSAPQIVLCDLAMPGMDGFDVLRSIRGLDDPLRRMVPVLAVTAYASDDYRARCLDAGFQGHVAKPYTTSDLVRYVAAALSNA
jgi:signal transduction histidine kinase/ActR/RegA family two-component response regulator